MHSADSNPGGDAANLPPVRVYILAGQSNAEGHNHVRQYRGGLESFPAAWQDQRAVLFWPGANPRAGSNQWTHLRVLDSGRFGPEIGFGREMIRFSPGEAGSIAVIKYASGGTGIARSSDYTDYIPSLANFDDRGRNWHPPTDGKPAGNLYTALLTNVHLALDTLSRGGRSWELAGFIWMSLEHGYDISVVKYPALVLTISTGLLMVSSRKRKHAPGWWCTTTTSNHSRQSPPLS